MGKLFDFDSPLMRGLSRMADLLILNILTLLLCIPIITAGASLTAMHYSCLKMVRNREGYVTKDFFKSFKQNFKQATIIELIIAVVVTVFYFDYRIITAEGAQLSPLVFAVILVSFIFFICVMMYVFPILAHFENTVPRTIRNAFFMSILALPRTLVKVAGWCVFPVLAYFINPIVPIWILFFFSGPAYLMAVMDNKTFERFEPEDEKDKDIKDDFTWSVNSDLEENGESDDFSCTSQISDAEVEKEAERTIE